MGRSTAPQYVYVAVLSSLIIPIQDVPLTLKPQNPVVNVSVDYRKTVHIPFTLAIS